jgi:hypothetical protein
MIRSFAQGLELSLSGIPSHFVYLELVICDGRGELNDIPPTLEHIQKVGKIAGVKLHKAAASWRGSRGA